MLIVLGLRALGRIANTGSGTPGREHRRQGRFRTPEFFKLIFPVPSTAFAFAPVWFSARAGATGARAPSFPGWFEKRWSRPSPQKVGPVVETSELPAVR